MTILRARWLAAALAVLMAAGACSGTPDDETTSTTAAPATAAPATTAPVTDEPTPTTTSVGDELDVATSDTQPTVDTTTPPTTEAEAAEADEDQSETEGDDPSTEPTETATSEPASGDEPETDESVDGDETSDGGDAPEPATGDESELDESTEGDESGESEEVQPEETAEAEEPAQPYWKYRSVGTAFPDSAFYDHNKIKALFPHCPPQPGRSFGWVDDVFAYWDKTYARWDTESRLVEGNDGRSYRIATGWWTDEQLEMFLPGSGLTAASARRDPGYRSELEYPTLWPEGGTPSAAGITALGVVFRPSESADGRYTFENLYRRLESIGYRDTAEDPAISSETLAVIRDDGVPGNSPNPAGISVGHLLAEWMITRYQYPPTTREPAAWAMRTLLTEREATCVAEAMTAVCNGQVEGPLSPVLDRSHRFGRVLWSLVCPDA